MEEYLVYVKFILKNEKDEYEYDFFFSETPEIVWGKDWDYPNPSICNDLTPDSTTYNSVKRVKTKLPLKTIQETSCYSMEYAISGAIALCWIDISELEEYPEKGRCVLHYNDSFEKVKEIVETSGFVLE